MDPSELSKHASELACRKVAIARSALIRSARALLHLEGMSLEPYRRERSLVVAAGRSLDEALSRIPGSELVDASVVSLASELQADRMSLLSALDTIISFKARPWPTKPGARRRRAESQAGALKVISDLSTEERDSHARSARIAGELSKSAHTERLSDGAERIHERSSARNIDAGGIDARYPGGGSIMNPKYRTDAQERRHK
ncbi:MAG: hypothetical protein CMH34_08600 [Microbacterium sp.]|nr:hypothetical protein [Microbacterium sp.]|tara:strand:- start:1697 stop:2299 length:603 start_codon:yes stop_codon:yes gene_type:complete